MTDIQSAIQGKYVQAEPNIDIPVAVEAVTLMFDDVSVKSDGQLFLSFLPNPRVILRIKVSDPIIALRSMSDNSTKLTLDSNPVIKWIITNANSEEIIATSHERIEVGSPLALSSAIFHLVNFSPYIGSPVNHPTSQELGRIVLSADGWKVTLDSTPNTKEIVRQLSIVNGYGITHVGKLERDTGKQFEINDGKELLDKLFYFLSFVRGSWAPPVLVIGYDESNKEVWEAWGMRHTYSWRSVKSWFDENHAKEILPDVFHGFMNRTQDELWNATIRQAIYWYILSNNLTSVDGALILAQTALELLAWTLLVQDKKSLDEGGFSRLNAANQLRLLLTQRGIPLDLPHNLKSLQKFAKANNHLDGPASITNIRNSLVHPSKKNSNLLRSHPGISIYSEAHDLAMWYIELVLLSLFGYKGKYSSRLNYPKWIGTVEKVPWAT